MPRGGTRRGAGRPPGSLTKRTREIADRAAEAGITPLEYMLRVMKHETAEPERQDRMAQAAAPFMHPRMSPMTPRGEPDVPMRLRFIIDGPDLANRDAIAGEAEADGCCRGDEVDLPRRGMVTHTGAMSAAVQKRVPSEPRRLYRVHALWDGEAEVWVATSDDVPGLVTEAATIEALIDDIRALVPELLELNAVPHPERIEVTLTAERSEAIERA